MTRAEMQEVLDIEKEIQQLEAFVFYSPSIQKLRINRRNSWLLRKIRAGTDYDLNLSTKLAKKVERLVIEHRCELKKRYKELIQEEEVIE
jgi:hypothetical protein